MATTKRHAAAESTARADGVLDEEEQERIIADLTKQWERNEKLHRIALTAVGVVLVFIKFAGMSVPFETHPAWDISSAALFAVSVASLYGHRLLAVGGLVVSGVVTLLWLPVVSLEDHLTIISLLWFGGLNVLYAAAAFHFRLTATASTKELRRLAEMQYPCKQA